MGLGHSPRIVTENLVLLLDAANPRNFNLTAVEVLVVAGGGSGGVDNGGGGGAGGLIYNSNFAVTPGTQLTATVGDGGAARAGGSDDGPGNNGANSVFGSLTAYGGGGGSGWTNASLPPGSSSYTGGNGAGQSASTSSGNSLGAGTGNRITGTTTVASGQGNNGGTAVGGFAGGGGGGGGSGGNASNGAAGAGGLGFRSNISGSQVIYAAGGAGGWDVISGYTSTLPFTENGTVKKTTQTAEDACPANTGHGGNGGNHNNNSSGAGGSGIIIVRYQGPQKAIGGTITSNSGYTIHTFTTSSTFTPLVNTNGSAVLGLSDLSGNRNFGTTANSPTYSTANGGSLVFDGTDDYILGTIPSSTFSGAHSIGCWFYRETVTEWAGLFSNNVNTTSCSIFTFISTSNSLGTNQAGVDAASISVDLGADHLNKWIYAVITYAGVTSGSAVNVYAYKNGSLLTATGSLYWNLSSSSSYYIGRHWTSGSQILDGFIPQVSVYNRALSATEIQQNYNALKSRFGL